MHLITTAFESLRRVVPSYQGTQQRLSKLAILRIACSYIIALLKLTEEEQEFSDWDEEEKEENEGKKENGDDGDEGDGDDGGANGGRCNGDGKYGGGGRNVNNGGDDGEDDGEEDGEDDEEDDGEGDDKNDGEDVGEDDGENDGEEDMSGGDGGGLESRSNCGTGGEDVGVIGKSFEVNNRQWNNKSVVKNCEDWKEEMNEEDAVKSTTHAADGEESTTTARNKIHGAMKRVHEEKKLKREIGIKRKKKMKRRRGMGRERGGKREREEAAPPMYSFGWCVDQCTRTMVEESRNKKSFGD